MAIPEKKAYKLYLDEENVEFLRSYLRNRRNQQGLSGLVDKYLARCVWMIKNNQDIFKKIEPGKLTFSKFWQLLKLQIKISEEQDNCDFEKGIADKKEGG